MRRSVVGYHLDPSQPLANEVRRIARRQIELALAGLKAVGDPTSNGALHDTRRHVKKIRALLRLVGPSLSRRARASNRHLRSVNRQLAPIADGQAVVATLSLVAERYDRELPEEITAAIRRALIHRESIIDERAVLDGVLETTAACLHAEHKRISGWRLRDSGFDAVASGLKQTTRAARRAMARAVSCSRSEDYHTWRRRVKDLWLQIRLLQARCADALAYEEKRLEELDGLLDECHNCALLCEVLASDSTLNRTDAARCLRLVRRYQRELRARARWLGAWVHCERPRAFVNRVHRYWRWASQVEYRRSTRQATPPTQRGTTWRPAA
jgi:hypothetical protein